VSRVPLTTSGSRKNASGQEVFGTKPPKAPIVESSAASAADVTSAAAGVGTTAAPKTDKAGTSTPLATKGEGGGHGTFGPQEEPPSGGIFAEGMEAVNDEDRCLYAGTPWEAEVVTDCCDLEKFKEVAHTIGTVLLVRVLARFLWFLLQLHECREVLTTSIARRESLAKRAQARTGLLREAANVHAKAAAAHEAKLQAEVAAAHEIRRVKEAMARQVRKDADDLKTKLEDAEQKAKDAASDLQAVVEGTFSSLLRADSMCFCKVLVMKLRP
jgi:hypothetical protein